MPVIIADVKDERSLLEMASRAKVVVNCVGPYRFHGGPVVRACINGGAHHVDVSGEPEVGKSGVSLLMMVGQVKVVLNCGDYRFQGEYPPVVKVSYHHMGSLQRCQW